MNNKDIMKRSSTATFVLTLPLIVKPGEDRILICLMEAGRRLYNATLGEALRRHVLLKQSKGWQHTRTIGDNKTLAKQVISAGSVVGLDIAGATGGFVLGVIYGVDWVI